ncbi:bifunctional 3,4-dihydroxy-2-butanone-4-phosphate synthase/GTP cyclohydrolase II [bacterium]|nr:bifunctional 3,4-dihydroxy-2-butanone-4-phosphate synthase/GTP cyclohydrolase II [bacterium]
MEVERIERVEKALSELRAGRFIIIVDDADRENEGDLAMAAEFVTPEAINFLETNARGLIVAPMTGDRLDVLELPLMVEHSTERHGTAFTISVDAREGTTTGISAADRAKTIQVLIDNESKPDDLLRPGHTFPLRADPAGVLRRIGQTEGIIDLAKLAGLKPGGVICEIKNKDGSMARMPDLEVIAGKLDLHIVQVADIVHYRLQTERWVEEVARAELPTKHGDFKIAAFVTKDGKEEHVALILGDISPENDVLVRVHSQCLTGDTFGSLRCDCKEQLNYALKLIGEEGTGVIVYLNQEGRGIGLANKIKAYALQDKGYDTEEANVKLGFPPDQRQYGVGAQILRLLGVRKIRLITNNPRKMIGLEGYGLSIVDRVQIPFDAVFNEHNRFYLETKEKRMGHIISDSKGDWQNSIRSESQGYTSEPSENSESKDSGD